MTDVAAGPDPANPDEPSPGTSCADERGPGPTGPSAGSRHARPVRWLAVALTLSVSALLGTALTGALAPQVYPEVSPGPAWAGGGRVEVEVRNEAVASTRLVDAGEDVPGLDLVGVEVATPDGGRSELGPEGVVIPGGGRATVVLAYDVTDCGLAALASSHRVPLRFRTPLGLTRTLEVRHAGVWANPMAESSCPEGAGGPVA